MQEGKGKFVNRPTVTGKRKYDRFFIYIPTEVARDSAFPFSEGGGVKVKITKNGLLIEKI